MYDWIISLTARQGTQEVTVRAMDAVQAVNRAPPEAFRFSAPVDITHISVKRLDNASNSFESILDTTIRADSVSDALAEARRECRAA